ncbi:hypothetical protein DFJ58DRAFT_843341 [Suillus subalutaceus]|uniref:uncharacterized protein n=1 Tax=Suillus subalutaceus TaxID=48586 RepID=UPI001B87F2DE|nr:uncharacterized protein DFJ58DRAFT_843341 [Suillus subalutaceus]KAG1847025.1 hypothetical protein DFJ58DRAFT_843341 [Suillus subalutaceus]
MDEQACQTKHILLRERYPQRDNSSSTKADRLPLNVGVRNKVSQSTTRPYFLPPICPKHASQENETSQTGGDSERDIASRAREGGHWKHGTAGGSLNGFEATYRQTVGSRERSRGAYPLINCLIRYSGTGDKKDQPLQYAYVGFGRRKRVKMDWPMAIVNLNLESMKDDYLATTVKVELEDYYRMHPHNLFIQTLHMRGSAHVSESRKLANGLEFMRGNISRGFPPNTFIIVDTHSDEFTGMLQHTGGHTGGTNTTITEIVEAYLGTDFLKCMGEASDAARSDDSTLTTAKSTKPWCDLTAKARGGWRGLLLVSCGPAIRVSHHFESVLQLVKSNQFEVVVGFGGSGTLPSMVSHTVRSFIVETGVFGRTDPWSAICHMLTSNHDVLDYTTAVVVYATTVNGSRQIECRQIAKDAPGLRAFGYEFKSCGKPGCTPCPADLRVFNHKERVRVRCLRCHWQSSWARTDRDNKHFKRVNALAAPQLFWHYFPPSPDLQNFFVDLTERQNDTATRIIQKGRKRGRGQGKKKLQKKTYQQDTQMLDLTQSEHSPHMEVDE